MVKRITKITPPYEIIQLFGKNYNNELIHSAIRNSIIARKYIFNDTGVNNLENNDVNVYDNIQDGEAQGFSFTGDVKSKRSKKVIPVISIILSIILSIFYIFYFSK